MISAAALKAAAESSGCDMAKVDAALAAIEGDKFLIETILGREILDSRGNPIVEVDLTTKGGIKVRAAVPSGASTGIHKVCEFLDGDKARYLGKGCIKAVNAVNTTLSSSLKGMDVRDQCAVDANMCWLDGIASKGNLGANAILGVSPLVQAFC